MGILIWSDTLKSQLMGNVRIIAGKWRSRKITFPILPGLRPTQDRIRETLFNWLSPYIEGANCLDLFAGSGVLGFEALSRGARHVSFVDSSRDIIISINDNAQRLEATTFDVVLGTCPNSMSPLLKAPFDLVFLDPPFHHGLVQPTLEWLEREELLKKDAFVYIELESGIVLDFTPSAWSKIRHKKTSTLEYFLYQCG